MKYIKCKDCGKNRKHEAKGLCRGCYNKSRPPPSGEYYREYYQKNKKHICFMTRRNYKKNSKKINRLAMIKKFGFVPVLYSKGKCITACGCSIENSILVSHKRNITKSMWLYGVEAGYLIQIYSSSNNTQYVFKVCRERLMAGEYNNGLDIKEFYEKIMDCNIFLLEKMEVKDESN